MTTINGWEKTPFGEIATLVKGVSYASEDYCGPGQGAIFLTIKCVSKAGGFKPEGIKYFKGEIADSQELHAGDLLIANTDLTRAGDIVGAPIVVPSLNGETITMSMDLSKVVEDDGKIDRQFLYFVLMTDRVRRFMKDHASGSTVLHLQTRAVPTLEFDMPNKKPEQIKIAEILSTVDQAIEQTEALIAKQQRIKTGLMQDLLTRGIDENGNRRSEETHEFKDSPLGRIPVEWEVQRLEQSVEFWDGKRIPLKQEDRDRMQGDYPYYGASGIIDYINKYLFDDDLILIGEDGENVVSRNLPLAFRVRGKIWVNNHAHVLKPKEGYDINFLTERLEFYDYTLLISGSAQPKLNQRNLRLLELPMPPELEQARVGAILSTQEEWCRWHDDRLLKLQRIKTGLMQDLLTGKVSVAPLLTDLT